MKNKKIFLLDDDKIVELEYEYQFPLFIFIFFKFFMSTFALENWRLELKEKWKELRKKKL